MTKFKVTITVEYPEVPYTDFMEFEGETWLKFYTIFIAIRDLFDRWMKTAKEVQ